MRRSFRRQIFRTAVITYIWVLTTTTQHFLPKQFLIVQLSSVMCIEMWNTICTTQYGYINTVQMFRWRALCVIHFFNAGKRLGFSPTWRGIIKVTDFCLRSCYLSKMLYCIVMLASWNCIWYTARLVFMGYVIKNNNIDFF
jgi:hypothetical protein